MPQVDQDTPDERTAEEIAENIERLLDELLRRIGSIGRVA